MNAKQAKKLRRLARKLTPDGLPTHDYAAVERHRVGLSPALNPDGTAKREANGTVILRPSVVATDQCVAAGSQRAVYLALKRAHAGR